MDPIAFSIGPFDIRWYAVCILLGVLAAWFVCRSSCKRMNIDTEHLLNIILFGLVFGVLGARAYYVIFRWSYYSLHPAEIPQIWRGGLAIHGAIIAGCIVIWVYSRLKKHCFRQWLDIMGPGVILAQGIGRWGNFFNQEAYGFETDLPWAMYIDGARRHPTFLYESIWDVAGFVLLFALSRSKKPKVGDIAALYFIWYSCGRFVIEWFRTDSLMGGGLKAAMVMSLLLIILGCALLFINRRFPVTDISAMQIPLFGNKSKSQKKQKHR